MLYSPKEVAFLVATVSNTTHANEHYGTSSLHHSPTQLYTALVIRFRPLQLKSSSYLLSLQHIPAESHALPKMNQSTQPEPNWCVRLTTLPYILTYDLPMQVLLLATIHPRALEPDLLHERTLQPRPLAREQVRVIPPGREALLESPVLVLARELRPIGDMLPCAIASR